MKSVREKKAKLCSPQSELYYRNFNSAMSFCCNWRSILLWWLWLAGKYHISQQGGKNIVSSEGKTQGRSSFYWNTRELCHSVNDDDGDVYNSNQGPQIPPDVAVLGRVLGNYPQGLGIANMRGLKKYTLLDSCLPEEVSPHSQGRGWMGQVKLSHGGVWTKEGLQAAQGMSSKYLNEADALEQLGMRRIWYLSSLPCLSPFAQPWGVCVSSLPEQN